MRADMARHDAGEQIISAARRRADDETDLLAAIKTCDVVGGARRSAGLSVTARNEDDAKKGAPRHFQSIFVARSAPSRNALTFSQTMVGCTSVDTVPGTRTRNRRRPSRSRGRPAARSARCARRSAPDARRCWACVISPDTAPCPRQLYALEQVILVLVARICGLETVGAGIDLQHVIHDVGQCCLIKPGAFVDAITGMVRIGRAECPGGRRSGPRHRSPPAPCCPTSRWIEEKVRQERSSI